MVSSDVCDLHRLRITVCLWWASPCSRINPTMSPEPITGWFLASQRMLCSARQSRVQAHHVHMAKFQAGVLPLQDAKVRMYLVYLKYWTLNLMPLMVYPKVLFHLNFSIWGCPAGAWGCASCRASSRPAASDRRCGGCTRSPASEKLPGTSPGSCAAAGSRPGRRRQVKSHLLAPVACCA